MPSINMIAARRAEKLKLQKQVRGMVLTVFAEIAIILVIVSVMTARIIGAGLVVDRLNNDLKKIEPTVKRIAEYESRVKDLTPRMDLLASSRESTMLWTNVMGDVSRSMPAETWLSNMQTSVAVDTQTDPQKKTPRVMVTLMGTSSSQRLVGEAMLRLGQNTEFDKVDLNFTMQNSSREFEAVDFSLAARLKATENKKEESKDVKN